MYPCSTFLHACVVRRHSPTYYALSNVWYMEHIHKHSVSLLGTVPLLAPDRALGKGSIR